MKKLLMVIAIATLAFTCVFSTCNNAGETKKHEHVFGDYFVTKEATCTENGEKVRYCTECKQPDDIVVIPALGHDIIKDEAVSATCLKTGLTAGEHCSRCDYKVEQTEIPALGHDIVKDEAVSATCLKTGLTAGEHCSRCGYKVEQTEVPALGHDIVKDEAVSATCLTTGLTAGEHCSRCDYKVEQTETPALGHDIVKDEAVSATCLKTGLTAGEHCSRCDYKVEQTEIPALGHDIIKDEAVSATCLTTGLTAGEHCSRCDYKVEQTEVPALGHDIIKDEAVSATCLTTGLTAGEHCSRCDYKVEQIEVPALGHDIIKDEAVSATCLKTGLTAGEHCSRCDYKVEQTEVPALGHDIIKDEAVSATCLKSGLTAGEHCSRCDYKVEQTEVPALGHDIIKDEAVSATCQKTGLTAGEHCSRCDYKIAQQIVPKTDHVYGADGTCKFCGESKYVVTFELNSDGKGYTVAGLKKNATITNGVLIIPGSYKNLPVTEIKATAFRPEYDYGTEHKIKKVIIEEGVLQINGGAFENCDNIEEVWLPKSLTRICYYAFANCEKLKEIVIPAKVVYLESHTFNYCTSLKKVTILGDINTSEAAGTAFEGCLNIEEWYGTPCTFRFFDKTNLKKATMKTLGSNSYFVDRGVLYGANSLVELSIPQIGDSASDGYDGSTEYFLGKIFWSQAKSNSIVPASLKKVTVETGSLPATAFSDCSHIEEIILLGDIYIIEAKAFYNCASLVKLNVPSKVALVAADAFTGADKLPYTVSNNCRYLKKGDNKYGLLVGVVNKSAKTVINDGAEIIACGAFDGVQTSVMNKYDNAYYLPSSGNSYFALVKSASQPITSCKLNAATKIICARAFRNCYMLKAFEVPASVISIGEGAIEGCAALETLSVPFAGVVRQQKTDYVQLTEGFLFGRTSDRAQTRQFVCVGKYSQDVFFNIPSTITLIKTGGKYIQKDAFMNMKGNNPTTRLMTVIIGDDVEEIDETSFIDNYLKAVVIGKNVKKIGYNVFNSYMASTAPSYVYYNGSESEFAQIKINADDKTLTAPRYYYSEQKPLVGGQYWHYVDGMPVAW